MNEKDKFETILLVDDDPVINRVHRYLIERASLAGAVVDITGAAAALDFLRDALTFGRRLPDLILLDTHMPGGGSSTFLDGFATLRLSPNVPQVVAMVSTALLPVEIERITHDPNVSATCAYPLSHNSLMAVIIAARARCQPSIIEDGGRRLS